MHIGESDKHQTLRYQSVDGQYRDAHWYKDTWIGFSTKNNGKRAVVHHTFIASWIMGCLNWQIVACTLWVG